MKTFTFEQLQELSQYEDRFYTAVNLDYYRNLSSRVLTRINEIYVEAGGNALYNGGGCGHCVLTFLKTVGKKYFAEKEAVEAARAKEEYEKAKKEVLEDPEKVIETEDGTVIDGYALEIEDALNKDAETEGEPVPEDKAEEFIKVLDEVFEVNEPKAGETVSIEDLKVPVRKEPEPKAKKTTTTKKTTNKATNKK